MSVASTPIAKELRARFGEDVVLDRVPPEYLHDATEARGLRGHADAVVRPRSAEEVAELVAWAYEHETPITTRGGGTGFAGGAVPLGGIVVALERLTKIRSLDPLVWRMEAEAGVTTLDVRRLARENGLLFPPDPGAAEQSQIGGNVATNAGGPHAFKYGVTGDWVLGVEAVVAPGELVRVGGAIRKDVSGYDLTSLLVGSEGTLGVITSVWLALTPAPEAVAPVVSLHRDTASGCEALATVLGMGFKWATTQEERTVLWQARHDAYFACLAMRPGGRVLSTDACVPISRLADCIDATEADLAKGSLPSIVLGHVGDGNFHVGINLDPTDPKQLDEAEAINHRLVERALAMGGTCTGEHGIGLGKIDFLEAEHPSGVPMMRAIKRALDPRNLMNPGKMLRM